MSNSPIEVACETVGHPVQYVPPRVYSDTTTRTARRVLWLNCACGKVQRQVVEEWKVSQ